MTNEKKNYNLTDPDYLLYQETLSQPLDHFTSSTERLDQRIFIFLPQKIGQTINKIDQVQSKDLLEQSQSFPPQLKKLLKDTPVFFILGNEDNVKPDFLIKRIKNYGHKEVIFLTAEHRGYGPSISNNPDQSIPSYVSIPQALHDYHEVVQKYKHIFTGPWIAAGYSYGGGLVINFGYSYPDDIELILSSSGVVDWSILMDTYDQQVRQNLGLKLYQRLTAHVTHLKPNEPFDQNWKDRELILAFVTGFSQMDTFKSLLPLFRFIAKLSTKRFVRLLKWIDSKFAANGAADYVTGNSQLQISAEDAKSGHYTWHVWRYQQFNETGVFWQSPNHSGIYQRTLDDLRQECQILFGENPPLLDKPIWDPMSMVSQLKIPLIFVCGGKDPWKGVCLPPNYKIPNGKYFYFHQYKHCPEANYPDLGTRVMDDIIDYLSSPDKELFFSNNSFYTTEESKQMLSHEEFKNRLTKLQTELASNALDAFIISDPGSIYYYTGASYKAQERPFFIIVFPSKRPTFLVPKLEESHMEKANIGNVVSYWEFPAPEGRGWPEKMDSILIDLARIGVEPSMSIENWIKVKNLKNLHNSSIESSSIVEELRLIKSPAEIAMIRESARYADMGMGLMMKNAYYGVSVLEMFSLGKKIQLEVIKTGEFDPLQTEFLTASWPAPFSAKPHGVPPVDGKLMDGPLAAMCYLRVNGYAAECERTFCLAPPTEQHKQMFQAMQVAREKAFAMVKPGVRASDVDKAAMDYLTKAGYGDYLLHRTGHGIGQGNHEGPWVAEGSDHILQENMVISIEPGIYIPEIGGVRHSDTVLITKDGYECLTKYPTDLKSLTILKKRFLKKIKGQIIQKAVGMK